MQNRMPRQQDATSVDVSKLLLIAQVYNDSVSEVRQRTDTTLSLMYTSIRDVGMPVPNIRGDQHAWRPMTYFANPGVDPVNKTRTRCLNNHRLPIV